MNNGWSDDGFCVDAGSFSGYFRCKGQMTDSDSLDLQYGQKSEWELNDKM